MVRGLLSFLKNNREHLAHRENLSDKPLVIDANNVLCVLYTEFTCQRDCPDYRNDIYGGDMVRYGQIVKEFFANLEKCNITPVLIFDGAVNGKPALKETVVSKDKESKRRGLEKFERAKKFEEFPKDKEIMIPQNISYIFRYVASECGAQIIQAPYEADTHIARVANQLQCPVLSNDSDFFIYELKKGFIMFESLDFKRPQAEAGDDNKWSLEATIFSQDKLTKSLPNFRMEVMPLLSILLGNDFVDASVFDRIVQSICKRPYRGQFIVSSFTHRRIGNLLTWLGGKSLDEAIWHILRLLKPEYRQVYSETIHMLLRNYLIQDEDDFNKELESVYPPERVVSSVHQAPTQFLRQHLEKHDLGSIVLYKIFHDTHYNFRALDDFTLPSSTEVSFRPISLAMALLRSKPYENLTESERRDQSKRDSFAFYDRKDGQYAEFLLEPMETLEGFGSLEHLDCYSMIALDTDTKLKLLMTCFRTTAEEQKLTTDILTQVYTGPFIEQASLCFLLIKYIGLESKLAPSPHFVNALMLTLVFYASKDGQLNEKSIPEKGIFDQLMGHLQPLSVMNNGEMSGEPNQSLFRRISHFISQLQVALKSFGLVNTLLGHPYHRPRQELYFNGILIYRITKLLLSGDETIESICSDMPLLIDVCDSLQAQVRKCSI